MNRRVDVGYVPLLDAAPLIIAAEMGFAAEEGLELALYRELSWAALRDRLIWGRYHAAHMLAPVVVAQTAGIGVGGAAMDALMVLSVNGDMIGAEPALAGAIAGTGCGFLDAGATGRALAARHTARISAAAQSGSASTVARDMASTFSGANCQIAAPGRISCAAPISTATLPQGSPTQKASISPPAIADAIRGGGTVTRSTPPASPLRASQ